MELIPELRSRWEVARKSLGEKKQVVTRLVVFGGSYSGGAVDDKNDTLGRIPMRSV